MNYLANIFLWCIFQVTLFSLIATAAYLWMRRFGPKAASLVLMTSLVLIVGLSAMMFSPWPRWMQTASAGSLAAKEASDTIARKIDSSQPVDTEDRVKPDSKRLPGGEDAANPNSAAHWALAVWLQTLDGASNSRRAAELQAHPRSDHLGWWPIAIVAIVASGAALGLLRLLIGLTLVSRFRHQSEIIQDPHLSEMTDSLLKQLGCRRRLELRESAALVSAATVGWRRPIILLPMQWKCWNEQQLRSVLAHELAHVRSNDYLVGILGQLGVALHFYHPLIHWLMGRLRLEQEIAADGVAAHLSGGPQMYLETIARMALAQDDPHVSWPARAFLPTHSTFVRRISKLRHSEFPIAPVPRGVRMSAVCVILLMGLAVLGLRPTAHEKASAQSKEPANGQTSEIRSSDRERALDILRKTIEHGGEQTFRRGEFAYEVTSRAEVPNGSEIADVNRRAREQLLAASEAATDPKQKAHLKSLAEGDLDFGPSMIANATLRQQFQFAFDGSPIGGDRYFERRVWDAGSATFRDTNYLLFRRYGAGDSDCIQLDEFRSGKVGPIEKIGMVPLPPQHFGRISGTIIAAGPVTMLTRLHQIELTEGLQYDGRAAVEIQCRVKDFHAPGLAEIKYLVVPTMGYIVPSVQEYDGAGNLLFECKSEDYFEIADSGVMFPRKCVTTTGGQKRRVENYTFDPAKVKINADFSRGRLKVPVPKNSDLLVIEFEKNLVCHSPVELGIDDIAGLFQNPAFHESGEQQKELPLGPPLLELPR